MLVVVRSRRVLVAVVLLFGCDRSEHQDVSGPAADGGGMVATATLFSSGDAGVSAPEPFDAGSVASEAEASDRTVRSDGLGASERNPSAGSSAITDAGVSSGNAAVSPRTVDSGSALVPGSDDDSGSDGEADASADAP